MVIKNSLLFKNNGLTLRTLEVNIEYLSRSPYLLSLLKANAKKFEYILILSLLVLKEKSNLLT